jgi:hypothetical protein
MEEKLNIAYTKSTLQKSPQHEKINDILIDVIERYYEKI